MGHYPAKFEKTDWNITTYDLTPNDNKTHKICSVFDQEINFNNAHGYQTLPACGPDKEYTFVEIPRGLDKIEHGDLKIDHVWCYTAKSMAQDYIGYQRDQTDRNKMNPGGEISTYGHFKVRGVFVPAGAEPTEKELEEARRERDNFYALAVDAGDANYAMRGNVKDVGDNAKRGARLLGIERNWNKAQDRKTEEDCKVCGKRIQKGIIRCPHCEAIFDLKEAAKYGIFPAGAVPAQTVNQGGGATSKK